MGCEQKDGRWSEPLINENPTSHIFCSKTQLWTRSMDILQLFFGGVSLQFVKFIRRDNSLWKEWVHRQIKVKYYPPRKSNIIEENKKTKQYLNTLNVSKFEWKDCLKLQVPPLPLSGHWPSWCQSIKQQRRRCSPLLLPRNYKQHKGSADKGKGSGN